MMSIALARRPSSHEAPLLSRAERLHALLSRFAVKVGVEAALIGDDQGFLVAGSGVFDGPEGDAWAAAALHALGAAARVQRLTGYRVSPEADVKVSGTRRLYASILPGGSPHTQLTIGVLGAVAPTRGAVQTLGVAVREVLGG